MINKVILVAIRFRWIWVEKLIKTTRSHGGGAVAIRFRWIWVEKATKKHSDLKSGGRNPLSLDMGWKVSTRRTLSGVLYGSQSAFAGYGLKRLKWAYLRQWKVLSQSAFAGYGLKSGQKVLVKTQISVAIRFRWIWVEKGLTRFLLILNSVAIRFRWIWVEKPLMSDKSPLIAGRNPLSLDMGWKGFLLADDINEGKSQSAFAGYGLKSNRAGMMTF